MQNQYIKGVAIAKYDAQITDVMQSVVSDEGKTMRFAIENEENLVYRVFSVVGLRAYLYY